MYKSFLSLLAGLLLFTACSSVSTSTPGTLSELQLAGYVSGSGSNLTLNGQNLNLSGATISKDDSSSDSSAIQPGVELSGKGEGKSDGYHFSEVSVNSRLKGLVDAVDYDNASLEVVGVKVTVDALTVIVRRETDGSFTDLTLADLSVGDYLEVHGAVQTDDSVIATRLEVESEDSTNQVELRMPIRNLDSSTQTFSYGLMNHVVDYSSADFNGNLAEGSMLRFKGTRSGNVITVSKMRSAISRDENASGRMEIEGPISDLDESAQQFSVLGYTVDYSSATVRGTLAVGARIEAKGSLNDSGMLVASKVEVKHEHGGSGRADSRNKGPIEAIDLGKLTVTVAGSSFWIDENTKLEKNDAHVSLSDFAVGDWVEIKADSTRSNDQGFAYVTKMESGSEDGSEDSKNDGEHSSPSHGERELSGAISSFDASAQSFTVGNITVVVTGSTEYKIYSQKEDDVSASTFWSEDRSGVMVKVEGSLDGDTLTAREIKIR
ncbi:MAG: hypothetical protein KC422_09515 [Trueperaceae bacterium]|nr:hypothetical protein [Trueperaceae bacterium]